MNSKKMKAVVATSYGSPDVLQINEIDRPVPKDHEIRIKVHATSVTRADTMMRRAEPPVARLFLGFSKPKAPAIGTGFSGVVESAGKDVTHFKTGDAVFGETTTNFGANAEYVCIPEDGVVTFKPENISHEEAAPICDGPLTSLNFLKNIARIQPGQRVLINGASGSLGTAAVQLAHYFGAEVTGVSSTANLEWVKALGADHMIDYSTTDFTRNGTAYDVIFDTVGKRSFSECRKALTEKGVYMSPVLGLGLLFQMVRTSFSKGPKAKFSATGMMPAPELRELLQQLKDIIEKGALTIKIDRHFPLEQALEAHRYVDRGHKKGNVVLTVG